MLESVNIKCPNCIEGKILMIFPIYSDDVEIDKKDRTKMLTCSCCDGYGFITAQQLILIETGQKIRQKRIDEGFTLRDYCKKNNISIESQSKMERGF